MTHDRPHHEIEELLGAYALDAIDDEERTLVERHLAECAACRAEVDGHREAASLIAQSASRPPAEVWARIAESLAAAEPTGPKAVSPLERSRRWFTGGRRTWRLGGALAAGAAAAAIVVLAVQVATDDGGTTPDLAAVAAAAAENPDAETVSLRSEDGSVGIDAVVLPDGTGYLVRNNLEPLPPSRTYQLWAIIGDKVISAGVLGPRPAVVAFHVEWPLDGLAVTQESNGGVVQSANPAVAAWLKTV